MANVKKITHLHGLSGLTLYCIVRRDADDYLLNDADGAFAEAPVDFYIAMTEDSVLKGLYEKSESRAAWDNGDYTIIVCRQNGGSPAIASDTIVGGSVLQIISDAEFNEATSYNTLLVSVASAVSVLTGVGACTWAYTLTDSVSGLPITNAEVWVTTDLAGTNMVAHGFTNASGVVTFFLDAGTNYFWRQHGSYTFTNPDTEIVS